MREIKSRAWVTGLTKEPSMIYQYNPWEFSIDFKGTLTIHDYMIGQSFEKDDYKLMQFTGLHDKNGKEIYEGDVLYDDHHEEYGLVVFEEGGFRVNWETTTDDLFENCDVLEIAGNAYENPEVLEGADQ